MAYARVTSVVFPAQNVAEGERILLELNDIADQQAGHILGMVLRSVVNPLQYLRISLWQDRRFADHVSTTDHVVALRARLNLLTIDGHHREDSFEFVGDLARLRVNLPPTMGSEAR
ncbi:MAG: hypothetical protein KatS3mg061_0065 [Dehalococcoidia bacterium]|nr:MAG: hypothetical protein KatS3mg061_0065 [Dehalococcoidia bacterium]